MKPIVEKVLKSGIVDKGMAELLEKWGNLPEGASELVKNDTLVNATREHLQKVATELGDAVADLHLIKETQLDLDKLRWPTKVTLQEASEGAPGPKDSVYDIPAVMDRMGRLFFRIQDVREDWFVPGYRITRKQFKPDEGLEMLVWEQILESTVLFTGEQKIAIQVTTSPIEVNDLPAFPKELTDGSV